MPNPKKLEGAIIKLIVEYPRDWESLIDDAAIRQYAESAFEFHLIKRPQIYDEKRVRVPPGQTASSLSPLDLLDQYWRAAKVEDADALQKLAQEIISTDDNKDVVPYNPLLIYGTVSSKYTLR